MAAWSVQNHETAVLHSAGAKPWNRGAEVHSAGAKPWNRGTVSHAASQSAALGVQSWQRY